jgi:hypothetical protein
MENQRDLSQDEGQGLSGFLARTRTPDGVVRRWYAHGQDYCQSCGESYRGMLAAPQRLNETRIDIDSLRDARSSLQLAHGFAIVFTFPATEN